MLCMKRNVREPQSGRNSFYFLKKLSSDLFKEVMTLANVKP